MAQHNLDLSLNQQSKEVALLHSRLMNIRYTIAPSERLNEVFGQSTYQAVLLFQQRQGLPPRGVIDATMTVVNVASPRVQRGEDVKLLRKEK